MTDPLAHPEMTDPAPPSKPAPVKRATRKKVDALSKYRSDRDLIREARELIDDNIAQMKAVSKQLGKISK